MFCGLNESEVFRVAEEHVSMLMPREYLHLFTFVVAEGDFHGLRALLCNRDWIFAKHIHVWNHQLPVLLCNNTTINHRQQCTNGLAIGANAHHSAYMHHVAFIRTRRLLMCDLDESSDEAAEEFVHIDFNVEPEEVDVYSESAHEEDYQRGVVELPREYNRYMAVSSGVGVRYQVHT